MTELVSGRDVLRQARELYGHYQEIVQPREQKVAIIRFTPEATDPPDWQTRLIASRVSAEQKVKAFEHLGFEANHVVLPPGVDRAGFVAVLDRYSQDPATRAIIVQFPPPAHLRPLVERMDPSKDIDALLGGRSPYPACATAEGVYRVAQPFAQDGPTIAVVGSKGFVGQGIVGLLRENGHDPMTLDQGDDLRRVRDADIVISVTGNPGILGPDHIQPHHRVVIDSGFVPQANGGVQGDVHADAAGIPQNITPVPGGIGPVEMATLMERIVRQEVDPNVTPWQVAAGPYLDRGAFEAASRSAGSAPDTARSAPGTAPSVAQAARLRGSAGPPAGAPAGPTAAPAAPPRLPAQQSGVQQHGTGPQRPGRGGGGHSR
ncbi:tetrahydrofolate dehydrogenase/cyclohydrolase catalytic domain-containing protein [Streptomyces sp. NPDC058619]|uniref:tetrahydrofolate dehydrogenase/cyclohydrolase catalytic domain-containing protein n=1 Tax=unclassified Streptomyces TaxID=2593676 RepID=UPI00365AD688